MSSVTKLEFKNIFLHFIFLKGKKDKKFNNCQIYFIGT